MPWEKWTKNTKLGGTPGREDAEGEEYEPKSTRKDTLANKTATNNQPKTSLKNGEKDQQGSTAEENTSTIAKKEIQTRREQLKKSNGNQRKKD